MSIGNEENMEKVREAMAARDTVRAGNNAEGVVPIEFTSEEGNLYRGTVVFKRPSMSDLMRAGGIKSEYLRTAGVRDVRLVDETVKIMAHVMATLSIVLVKRPEWLLNLEEVQEADVLYHVYGKFEEWQDSFRKPLPKEPAGDSDPSDRE